jgi:hypothetical protein
MKNNFSNQLRQRRGDLVSNFFHGFQVLLYGKFKPVGGHGSGGSAADASGLGASGRVPFDLGELSGSVLTAFFAELPKFRAKDPDARQRALVQSCLLEVHCDADMPYGEVSKF